MSFKTYKFDKFERQDEETYVASARALRFLPARALKVEGFLDKPGNYVEFVLAEHGPEGWVFSTLRPTKDGIYYLVVVND